MTTTTANVPQEQDERNDPALQPSNNNNTRTTMAFPRCSILLGSVVLLATLAAFALAASNEDEQKDTVATHHHHKLSLRKYAIQAKVEPEKPTAKAETTTTSFRQDQEPDEPKTATTSFRQDQEPPHTSHYTVFDELSWPIRQNEHFASQDVQLRYTDFMHHCLQDAGKHHCDYGEKDRLARNSYQPMAVTNYTKLGFAKVKAPKPLFDLLRDFWERNRHRATPEFPDRASAVSPYHNAWEAPPEILHVANPQLDGGGPALMAAISNAAKDILQEWTGQTLAPASVYGIRIYPHQSILTPHVDRFPLISSAILNVDQDVDEDWILEVFDHDGVAHHVVMKPGDMVLYESHSVIHGRPRPLNGTFMANIFVHFEPVGDLESIENLPFSSSSTTTTTTAKKPSSLLPPYLLPDSKWAEQYRKVFPNGWTLLQNVMGLVQRGDLPTLQYVAQRDPSALTRPASNETTWQPIHMAADAGHHDILEYLLNQGDVDVNALFQGKQVLTPTDIALRQIRNKHMPPVAQLLRSHGGRTYKELQNDSFLGATQSRMAEIRAPTSNP